MRPWPVACLLLLSAFPAAADPLPDVPVMVGGSPDLDACDGVAVVHGLDPQGANRLAVRSGPGRGYRRIDRLGPRAELIVCEDGPEWAAVVYGPPGADCGLGGPIARKSSYRGRCRSGWVASRYLARIAD